MILRHCKLRDWFAINLAPGRQPIEVNFFQMDWEGGIGSLTINTVFSFQKYVLNFYAVDCYRYRCVLPT